MEYEPLVLSAKTNAGIELYSEDNLQADGTYLQPLPDSPPIGAQSFHGLPFLIGDKQATGLKCFLGFGRGGDLYSSPVDIQVKRKARYVIFAHALLETELWRGAPLGEVIATYDFRFFGGKRIVAPIRERFEIGNIPLPWGQFPFLSVPDRKDYLEDRYQGAWDKAGFRQTEVTKGVPLGYYLWAWRNPHPDRAIASIEIVPNGRKFVLAGITLGHLDEEPLVRSTGVPVKITVKDDGIAKQPFAMDVEVDRGFATYAYPLPKTPLDQLVPDMKGYGAPANDSNSPAYTHIAAIPSATVTVKHDNAVLGAAKWGDLEGAGAVETESLRLEVVDSGKNWVHVTVVDADTGEAIPCRVAFHSPEGLPYAPHGHHAPVYSNQPTWNVDIGGDVTLGQIAYAYIDGTCQGWLPRGRVLVDVARGYEYEPIRTWVDIEPGQRELKLELKRWIDMKAQGFFSGDTHVHFLSAQGSMTEAQAEDLNVVNLLQSQWGHLFTNTEEFTGRPFLSQDKDTIVYVSQENRQHMLGHLSLLGLKSPVMPWATGGPGEAELGGGLDITMSHWADAARAQGATVILPHLPTPNAESAALVATGRADAVEMLDFLSFEHLEYYRYLNGGYRLPLVGGTDKMSNETPVGLYRTYVQLSEDEEFTYDAWRQALKRGRTFLSGGPLLWFTVEGQPVGSEIKAPGGGTVEIEAIARSVFPIHSLQIVGAGNIVAETTAEKGARELRLHTRLKLERDIWLAARCAGPGYTARPHYDHRNRGIMAHTSPIYVTCQDQYAVFDSASAQYMLTLIDGGLSYIRHRSPQHREEETTYHHGLSDHIAYLEAPFHEAAEALHRRMHQFGIPH
ncbi:MAG: CehA/McbA family metallohydrolase [Chloroflexota bacterium]|nr:CehA/McbA family metallohydrolase [Chloroflexota bacterium]